MWERRHGWEDNIEMDFGNTVHRYGLDGLAWDMIH
jgi:hypothetical protein